MFTETRVGDGVIKSVITAKGVSRLGVLCKMHVASAGQSLRDPFQGNRFKGVYSRMPIAFREWWD